MKKESPILFSQPLIPEIISLNKDVTRRLTGLDKINENPNCWEFLKMVTDPEIPIYNFKTKPKFKKLEGHFAVFDNPHGGETLYIKSPYGQKGDLLWIRETWRFCAWNLLTPEGFTVEYKDGETMPGVFLDDEKKQEEVWINLSDQCDAAGIEFIPEDECYQWDKENCPIKWKPSIHMFKNCSRLWAEVVDIRPERLQDITECDARREGVSPDRLLGFGKIGKQSYKEGFFNIWINIHGSESLHKNPWVWRLEFKLISTTGKPTIKK